jgi:hypothetical protein
MSFEIKYDARGVPMKDEAYEAQLEAQKKELLAKQAEEDQQQEQFEENKPSGLEILSAGTSEAEDGTQRPVVQNGSAESEVEEVVEKRAKKPKLEVNLRSLRLRIEAAEAERERLAQERDAALRRAQELESLRTSTHTHSPSYEPEENIDLNISDDDLVEGKHIKQYIAAIDKKYERKFRNYEQQTSQVAARAQEAAVEARLKSQYPDFDQIVTQDNLKDLAAAYPELAATLGSSTDLYSKAVSAYTLITNLGISQKESAALESEIIKKNVAKPKPSSTAINRESPLSKAAFYDMELTPSLRQQIYNDTLKRAGRR